ncbi:hypothetical protein CHCC20335_4178 [Bacillus paralicheniformis]|nr:hypothetical protein CHCC20335_4178 [Bacillus paralicheniformis]
MNKYRKPLHSLKWFFIHNTNPLFKGKKAIYPQYPHHF